MFDRDQLIVMAQIAVVSALSFVIMYRLSKRLD